MVAPARDRADGLRVEYAGKAYKARMLRMLDGPFPDLALLSVDVPDHPTVLLAAEIAPGARLYAYGFTERYRGASQPPSNTRDRRGLSSIRRFKGGQIIPGLSGAPLLNMETWAVAGIVKSTRDRASDLGGGGVSSQTILERLPELVPLQRMFHNWDKRWLAASQQQRAHGDADEKPTRIVEIHSKEVVPRAEEHAVDAAQVPARTVLASLAYPQALAWFAPDSIALGSYDSKLRIGSPDGHIVLEFKVPESYPSAVDVHAGRWLAAVCDTKRVESTWRTMLRVRDKLR